MAGPYKFTMLWNFQGSGFSESWYYNVTGTLSTSDYAAFKTLADARDSLTATDVNLVGYRASDLSNPRNTWVKSFAIPSKGTTVPDTPTNAWLAIARGPGGQGRRQFWMRGLADAYIKFDVSTAQWVLDGDFSIKFDNFVNKVSTSPWSLRVVKSATASNNVKPVTGLVSSVNNNRPLLTVDPSGFDQDKPIIVSGFKKPLGNLNGTFMPHTGYLVGSATIILSQRSVTSWQALSYVSGGRVRQQEFSYVVPATVQLVSPRERRVGRAFGVPRGRRSVSR